MTDSFSRSYSGKILILGEYTVLLGTAALAVPVPELSGQWRLDKSKANPEDFAKFVEYLEQHNEHLDLDLDHFKSQLANGLYFDSNIPMGFGTGSSAALVAAILDRYSNEKDQDTDLEHTRKKFVLIESFFHGTSSGIDPLISFFDTGILQNAQGQISRFDPDEYKLQKHQFFLINTEISRHTEPLVQLFRDKIKDKNFKNEFETKLCQLVDQGVDAFMNHEEEQFVEIFSKIGIQQFDLMSEMIPDQFRALWLESMDNPNFHLKLCGAGGGGFILGIKKLDAQIESLDNYKVLSLS